jgi:hypothetical protein
MHHLLDSIWKGHCWFERRHGGAAEEDTGGVQGDYSGRIHIVSEAEPPEVSIKDNYVATWQDMQCQLAMETLPEGSILFHVDFAENYLFQVQNEIQSMHWQSS